MPEVKGLPSCIFWRHLSLAGAQQNVALNRLDRKRAAFSAGPGRLITFDKPFARCAAKLKHKPAVQAPWWSSP